MLRLFRRSSRDCGRYCFVCKERLSDGKLLFQFNLGRLCGRYSLSGRGGRRCQKLQQRSRCSVYKLFLRRRVRQRSRSGYGRRNSLEKLRNGRGLRIVYLDFVFVLYAGSVFALFDGRISFCRKRNYRRHCRGKLRNRKEMRYRRYCFRRGSRRRNCWRQ